MTAREPLYWDQSVDSHGELKEMSTAQLLEWQETLIDHYAANPTITLTVVSGSGTLSPTMADTRLQAGVALGGADGHTSSFPNESHFWSILSNFFVSVQNLFDFSHPIFFLSS